MGSPPGLEPRKTGGSPGGSLQRAASTAGGAAWTLYRAYLSGPVASVVPAPTRDALFQLFCDLRANVPKDHRFLKRHAAAFRPDTALGWVALSGSLGSVLSAVLLLSTVTLSISVAGLSSALVAVMAAGIALASTLGFLAFVLLAAAAATGAASAAALSAYVATKASGAAMSHVMQLVFGTGAAPFSPVASASLSTPIASGGSGGSLEATTEKEKEGEDEAAWTPTSTRPSTYTTPAAVLPPIRTSSPGKAQKGVQADVPAVGSPPSRTPPRSPPARSPLGKVADKSENQNQQEDDHRAGSPASHGSPSSSAAAAAIAHGVVLRPIDTTPAAAAAAASADDSLAPSSPDHDGSFDSIVQAWKAKEAAVKDGNGAAVATPPGAARGAPTPQSAGSTSKTSAVKKTTTPNGPAAGITTTCTPSVFAKPVMVPSPSPGQ